MQSTLTAVGKFKRESLAGFLTHPAEIYEGYPLNKPIMAEIIHTDNEENSRKLASMIGLKNPKKASFISNTEMAGIITADFQRFIHSCRPKNADAWIDLTVLADAGFDFIYEPFEFLS